MYVRLASYEKIYLATERNRRNRERKVQTEEGTKGEGIRSGR